MSTVIQDIERSQLRKGLPPFEPGDRVRVHFLVIEGNRKRPQVFEGVVIKRQGSGARETFTVRKQSFGVGVERTFPLHSPKIEKLEVASRGRVRRAKLYYLRGRVGKAARVAERRWGIDEEMVSVSEEGAVDASGEALGAEEEPIESEATEAPEAEGGEQEAGMDADSAPEDDSPESPVDEGPEASSETETDTEKEAGADEGSDGDAGAEADVETSQEGEQDEKDEA